MILKSLAPTEQILSLFPKAEQPSHITLTRKPEIFVIKSDFKKELQFWHNTTCMTSLKIFSEMRDSFVLDVAFSDVEKTNILA